MNQNLKPHPKVASAGAAGALTVLLVWILSLFHVDMPSEVASAVTVLLMSAAGWATPVQ